MNRSSAYANDGTRPRYAAPMTRARWLLAALIGLASRSRASEAILNVTLVVIECADARLPLLEASCRTWIPSFPHVVAYTDTDRAYIPGSPPAW